MVTLFRHHFHLTTLLQAMLEACLFFGLVYFSVRVLGNFFAVGYDDYNLAIFG